jgi:hypothetical protein
MPSRTTFDPAVQARKQRPAAGLPAPRRRITFAREGE